MKIALNMGDDNKPQADSRELRKLGGLITAFQDGAWDAEEKIVREMKPYLETLARKRAHGDEDKFPALYEASAKGLIKAAKKFDTSQPIKSFKVFALDYIDKSMDSAGSSSKGGFLGRLFGK